jgi:hypothetical protein
MESPCRIGSSPACLSSVRQMPTDRQGPIMPDELVVIYRGAAAPIN